MLRRRCAPRRLASRERAHSARRLSTDLRGRTVAHLSAAWRRPLGEWRRAKDPAPIRDRRGGRGRCGLYGSALDCRNHRSGPAERARHRRRHPQGGSRVRPAGRDAEHRRPRRGRAPVQPGVPGGDADRARPQLDPVRTPDVSVPRLGRPPRADRQARLGPARGRRFGLHHGAAAQRLLDRLRHRQSLPRVLLSLRTAAPQLRPVHAARRPARGQGGRRAGRDLAPLASPGDGTPPSA
jgi:hypothetical protein